MSYRTKTKKWLICRGSTVCHTEQSQTCVKQAPKGKQKSGSFVEVPLYVIQNRVKPVLSKHLRENKKVAA